MASGESPAVARRRLRLALRKAREEKRLTQGQVADALFWSLSKVQRIEAGDVTISATDVLALVRVYDIADSARVEELISDARSARRRGWWDEPRFREHLTAGTMELLQFESQASMIRFFSLTMVPGIIQTRDLAATVLDELSLYGLAPEDRLVRLEVRMRRREQVFERPDPPLYRLLIDESVLQREIGGHRITADQFQDVLGFVRKGALELRVMPFSASTPALTLMGGAFMVLELDDEDNAVLYREVGLEDGLVHASQEVDRYRRLFDQLWANALDEEASQRLVEARVAQLLATLSREK